MKIIIQCCASKVPFAGTFKTKTGKPIHFVANPSAVYENTECYYRPDDLIPWSNMSWRAFLKKYNDNYKLKKYNPDNLLMSGDLYSPPAYSDLINKFGYENVYVLSAGWGLVRSDYLLPSYDITFSYRAANLKRRKQNDHYHDFNELYYNMSSINENEKIYFFGGNSYLPLLYRLLSKIPADKIIYYISENVPKKTRYKYIRYPNPSGRKTNWHYDCIQDYIHGCIER